MHSFLNDAVDLLNDNNNEWGDESHEVRLVNRIAATGLQLMSCAADEMDNTADPDR